MFLVKGYKGTWYIKFQFNGKWTNKSTGTTIKSEAKTILRKFNPNPPKVQPTIKPTHLTLQGLIEKYTEIKFKNDKSISDEMKTRIIDLLFGHFGKATQVDDLTVMDFERYKNKRLNQKKVFFPSQCISPNTVNIELRAFKAIFNKAVTWQLINRNPLHKFQLCKIPYRFKQTITNEEKELLLKTIDHPVLKNMVIYTLLTGCRIGEVINIQWKDIDFQNRIINIFEKKDWNTKTGKPRQIPMSEELFNFIKSVYPKILTSDILERYVFGKENGYKYDQCFISRRFKYYIRKCRIDDYIHFHSLRHTAVSDLVKSGEQINKIQNFIGHKSIQTTMGYIHLNTEDLRNTGSRLSVNWN